jgi:hypothetical protein
MCGLFSSKAIFSATRLRGAARRGDRLQPDGWTARLALLQFNSFWHIVKVLRNSLKLSTIFEHLEFGNMSLDSFDQVRILPQVRRQRQVDVRVLAPKSKVSLYYFQLVLSPFRAIAPPKVLDEFSELLDNFSNSLEAEATRGRNSNAVDVTLLLIGNVALEIGINFYITGEGNRRILETEREEGEHQGRRGTGAELPI